MIFKKEVFNALAYKEFKYYVVARFLITVAISFQSVIIGWKIYILTNSKLLLGFIGLTEAIPAIGVALYGGYIADKYDKQKLYMYCLSFFALLSGMLIFITHDYFLHLAGLRNTVIAIYIIIFLTGIARGLAGPASFSLSTFLIPKHLYQNGATWSSSAWQLGAVIGPAFAGILFGFLGITKTFTIQLILIIFSVFLIYNIKPKSPVQTTVAESVWKSIQVGLKFVFQNKIILSCISLDLFAVLFGGAVALLPVYANDILHVGPQGLGALRAMPAVGAIFTMLFVAFSPIHKNAGYKLLFSVAGFGLCIILFGISTNFYLSLCCLMIGGALDGVSVIIRHTIIQLKTPAEMRGRVSAVNSMFIGSSNEIGEFESGVTARLFGTVPAVVFGGAMTILVVIVTYFYAPSIRKLELKTDED
ncbi:MAG: MFS transporter [Sphingobacteriales bacterium]|nr:MAG: MFS transporter [Sphingobacteriales bacterium]